MADSVQYARFVLKFQTPYFRKGEPHVWSLKFSVSGGNITSQGDSDTTALALAQPVLRLTSGNTSLVGYTYYNSGSTVATFANTYAVGTHAGNGQAYAAGGNSQQLEVCALATVRVGTSAKGKATYLSKHIHDVQGNPSQPGEIDGLNNQNTILAEWITGAGPENRIPISPTTGDQPTAPWRIDDALYTRQLRQGQKAKK
jgi:hypothetical protein